MNISELIKELQDLQEQYGDIQVTVTYSTTEIRISKLPTKSE